MLNCALVASFHMPVLRLYPCQYSCIMCMAIWAVYTCRQSDKSASDTLGPACRCAHTITWALKQISSSAQYARVSGKTEVCGMLASGRSAGHVQDTDCYMATLYL